MKKTMHWAFALSIFAGCFIFAVRGMAVINGTAILCNTCSYKTYMPGNGETLVIICERASNPVLRYCPSESWKVTREHCEND